MRAIDVLDDILTTNGEIAAVLHVSISSVRKWRRERRMPTWRERGGDRYGRGARVHARKSKVLAWYQREILGL